VCRSATLKLPLPSMHRKVSLVLGLVSSPCKEGSGTSPCKEGSGTIALAVWTYMYNTDVWNLMNNYHEK